MIKYLLLLATIVGLACLLGFDKSNEPMSGYIKEWKAKKSKGVSE